LIGRSVVGYPCGRTPEGEDDAESVDQEREDVRGAPRGRRLEGEGGPDLQRGCERGQVTGREERRQVRLLRRLDGRRPEGACEGTGHDRLLRHEEGRTDRRTAQPLADRTPEFARRNELRPCCGGGEPRSCARSSFGISRIRRLGRVADPSNS